MYLKHTRWIALFILGSVLLAACGGSSGTTSPGQATSAVSTSAPVAPTTPALEPTAAAPGGAGGDLATLGKTVYGANCAGCHGENGQGSGSFPALTGNAMVTGDPAPLIQFIVNGKDGSHQFGDKLSDQEIAAVITYVRTNWGNQAGQVTEDQVKSAR